MTDKFNLVHRISLINYWILPILICVFQYSSAQNYKFTNYSIDNGLAQRYVYAITQDKYGYLWIGTGEGISRFNGITFNTFTTEQNLSEDFTTCSLKDDDGNLWFGHNQGGISYSDGRKIQTVMVDTMVKSTINGIIEGKNKIIWAIALNGTILNIKPDKKTSVFNKLFRNKLLYSINLSPDSNLLIGTGEGLYICHLDDKREITSSKQLLKQLPGTKITSIVKSRFKNNTYWIGTGDEGVYELWFKTPVTVQIRNLGLEYGLDATNVQYMMEDKNNDLWIGTFGDGLYRMIYSETSKYFNPNPINYNTDNGLGDNYIKTLFQDREGNIWVGKYGSGLAILNDEFFTFYFNNQEYGSNFTALFFDKNDRWFAADSGLIRNEMYSQKSYILYKKGDQLPNDKITALYGDNDGFLWIGTEKNGVYKLNILEGIIEPMVFDNSILGKSINAFAYDGYLMWIATKGGVYALNPKSGSQYHYSTENGLVHNNINHVYLARNGNIYISSHSNKISIINQEKIEHLAVTNENQILNITSITEDKGGDIWVATYGNGIYKQVGSKFRQFTTKDGVKTDYCYSLIAGDDYDLWVGHREGLSKVNVRNNSIEVFGKKYGIIGDCNFNASFKDKLHNLWFGTNKGAIKYDPKKFLINNIPPALDITTATFSDKNYPVTAPINLPYDAYRLKIGFVGISFKNPENIKYQYILEGYDITWSEPTSTNIATYPRIEDGNYIFKVRACNSDGICNDQPTILEISISPPFWKTWWFIASVVLILIGVVYFIIFLREKNHIRTQRILEEQLAERTTEVVAQKEEIEKKNQDITDSITYAKRIQESILPDKQKLKDAFPESFIFFQPRDIVSGDFYWFSDAFGKFRLACADCTGHGVPGAFMSLISSGMFKEQVLHHPDISPGALLMKINNEIRTALKQDEDEFSFDGMDAIFCEFDIPKKILRYASAARPVLLVRNGKIIRCEFNMTSIGGFDILHKKFDTYEVKLKKNDLLYMFSDGYPDQFGGIEKRKIRLSGIFELIEQNWEKTMSEQENIFVDFFNNWKGDELQIDDVLFIGIQIT